LRGYAGLCRAELAYCTPVCGSSISISLDLTGEGAVTETKILWGQMALSLMAVLAGLWGATEWAAMRLGFQPALGSAWFFVAGVAVYEPYLFFAWWYHFDAYAPGIFLEGAAWATGGSVMAVVVAIAGSVRRARQSAQVTTYGSARWATEPEVREARLLEPAGIYLGRLGKAHLRHAGPEHVLCFASTRSGKGVGLVVPTLLSWPSSVVVHDIKGENWTLTAGWRSRFSHCLLFDPTDARSAAYNPLLEVRRGREEVRDVQNIADVLVDPEGSIERRNHWEKTSHSLLVGAILHVLYAEEDKTLAGVATFLSDPSRPIESTLRLMMATPHLGERGVHPVVAQATRELLNKSDNERSGVLSTAMSSLGLYRDPIAARVTSRCDWRISDLVEACVTKPLGALRTIAAIAAAAGVSEARSEALSVPAFVALANACAPNVAAETLAALARTESNLDPLALYDNTAHESYQPRDKAQAVSLAQQLLQAGHSIDAGIMQVTSGNFRWLGLGVEDAFEPCASIRAGATVLTSFSGYNTGSPRAGVSNGYVRRVLDSRESNERGDAQPEQPRPSPPAVNQHDWDVFPDEAAADDTTRPAAGQEGGAASQTPTAKGN
jgi:Type IV secretory system Conjugative DNA transfer/Transglycosylase SLT domain